MSYPMEYIFTLESVLFGLLGPWGEIEEFGEKKRRSLIRKDF